MRDRLAQFLLRYVPESAQEQQAEARSRLPLNKTDLAKILVIDPSYLSCLLSELEQQGAIRRSQGWIYVRSVELLKQWAQGARPRA